MSVGLTGQSITSAIGAPGVNDLTVGLTGVSITASQGTAFAPNDTVQPSGLSITSSQGTAGAISEQEVTLSGQLVTSSLGSLTIPNATLVQPVRIVKQRLKKVLLLD